MIKYSIIIPHYNSPVLLAKLLGTIPKLPEIQVIVIDDNSTRDTDALEKCIVQDGRCMFFINTTGNQSAGACRNIGLQHATGKWVLFADADDYFLDGFVNDLDKHYDSPADAVYFAPTSVDMQTLKKSNRHVTNEKLVYTYIKKKNKKRELMLKFKFVVVWSRMIRRNIIEDNKIIFEEIIASNDIMFSTKLGVVLNKIEAVMKPIYCVTKNPNTLTTTVSEKNLDERIGVHVRRCKYLSGYFSKREVRALTFNGLIYRLREALVNFGIKKCIKTWLFFYNQIREGKK